MSTHRHAFSGLLAWARPVRRQSWKTLVIGVLTIVALTAIGLALAQVGLGELAEAFSEASPGVLLATFAASQVRFVAFTVGLRGAMGRPLAWLRTTQLQYAIQLFALATPGDSARLVMTVDYAEKSGAKRSEAVGKAPLATVTGWVVDALVLAIAGIAVTTGAHGSSFTNELGSAWPVVVAMAGVLIAGQLAVVFVPWVRARVVPPLVSTLKETCGPSGRRGRCSRSSAEDWRSGLPSPLRCS